MLKKLVLPLLILVAGLYFFSQRNSFINKSKAPLKNISPTIELAIPQQNSEDPVASSKSIFVPYWSITGSDLDVDEYDRLIYFGISANSRGINTSEVGYTSLQEFVEKVPPGKKTYLTLRMIDSEIAENILKNSKIQDTIIKQTIDIAKQNGFDGIVLDLELVSFFDNQITGQINDFVDKFYTLSRASNLQFSQAIYGDVFYRKRPFDVSYIAKHTDEILIMAYDFHKSRGEPGPNFPYEGQEVYGKLGPGGGR